MKRAILIAGGLGVFVLGALFLYPRPVDKSGPTPEVTPPSVPTSTGTAPRRSLVPRQRPGDPPPPSASDAAPVTEEGNANSAVNVPGATALVGVEFQAMDDGLREKLKVPNDSQIGKGVVLKKIHPDSPAAEIFMRPNDVIVRANLKKVDSIEDLNRLIGDRGHTLITISRDGSLMQMVLKKPFQPE